MTIVINKKTYEAGELIAYVKRLEKENAELKEHIKADCIDCADYIKNQKLEKENAELKEKLNRYKHDCPSCTAFGKHCPHKVKGDPYFYDCYLTVIELEQENTTLKKQLEALSGDIPWKDIKDKSEVIGQLAKAKELLAKENE